MQRMVCTLMPEMEREIPPSEVAGYTRNRKDFDPEFAQSVECAWQTIVWELAGEAGPRLDAALGLDIEKLDREADAQVKELMKQAPLKFRIGAKILGAIGWAAEIAGELSGKPSKEKQIHRVVYDPIARSVYRSLLDSLTAETVSSGSPKLEVTAEEWAELCLPTIDPVEFRKLSGIEETQIPAVIGCSALTLIELPLFKEPQPMVGQRNHALTLQTTE